MYRWNLYNISEAGGLYWTVVPPIRLLRKGKTSFREKLPIALNNVLVLYQQSSSDLKQKGNLVILQVQTAHFGMRANPKQEGTSFVNNIARKLDRIKNNPLDIIVTLLTIYQEVLPSIIYVGLIAKWELCKTMCMGTAVANGKTWVHISGFQREYMYCRLKLRWIQDPERKTKIRIWRGKVIQ